MITEDYVSLETAKLLKEKGFDIDECEVHYDPLDNTQYDITLQMVMKWLREVHNIHIAFTWCSSYRGNNLFSYHIDKMNDVAYNGYDSNEEHIYEEACEAAIKYCLENLI